MNHSKIFFKHEKKTSESGTKLSKAKMKAKENARAGGLAMCPKCHAFYYKKSWHHNTDTLPKNEAEKLHISFVLCPADEMIQKGLYEGEVTIQNFPKQRHVELLNLIRGFGKRAYTKDCQHRISEIDQISGDVRVRTTENQLVQKLAHKIKDVFNKVQISIVYSKEPHEVERVRVAFKS